MFSNDYTHFESTTSGEPVNNKTVPMSVRISEADADFLSMLQIKGATTPSEKLRAIIAEARQRHSGERSYGEALALLEDIEAPALRRLRDAERVSGLHSELVLQLANWLPDAMAFLLANLPQDGEADSAAQQLRELEDGLADRVFAFIEQVLRQGVTRRAPCYDPSAIRRRIEPAIELSEVIQSSMEKGKGDHNG